MKVLITGASSGMGREMARILADTYDEVILVGRDKKRLNELKDELSDKSKIEIEVMDLSDILNCKKLYQKGGRNL